MYGYAILLGVGGSLSLVTCLGMLSHLIGENVVSIKTRDQRFVSSVSSKLFSLEVLCIQGVSVQCYNCVI